jgi:hypothetical protein
LEPLRTPCYVKYGKSFIMNSELDKNDRLRELHY